MRKKQNKKKKKKKKKKNFIAYMYLRSLPYSPLDSTICGCSESDRQMP